MPRLPVSCIPRITSTTIFMHCVGVRFFAPFFLILMSFLGLVIICEKGGAS